MSRRLLKRLKIEAGGAGCWGVAGDCDRSTIGGEHTCEFSQKLCIESFRFLFPGSLRIYFSNIVNGMSRNQHGRTVFPRIEAAACKIDFDSQNGQNMGKTPKTLAKRFFPF